MVKLVLLTSAFALAVTAVSAQVPVYGQCGGQGYTGSTSCASGSTCVYSNDWYSQCLPGAAAATSTTKSSTTKSSTTKTTKTSTTKTTKSSTIKTTKTSSSTTSKATTVTVTSTVLPPTTTTSAPPTGTGLPGYPACQGKDYNGAEGGPWCFAQFEPTCSDKGLGAPSDLPAAFPEAEGRLSCNAPRLVANGTTFDGKLANNGKLVRYDRGPGFRDRYGENCLSVEPGEESVVFVLGHGATLKNVIIGQEIGDAIYCYGDCHLENIYWEKICEDGWSIKYAGTNPTASLKGGMIYGFTDKAIQHNSGGTVSVEDVDVWYTTGGKMYRSCGDCPKPDSFDNRKFVGTNIRVHGKKAGSFVRVNGDRGDTATLKQINLPENFGSTKYPVCDTSGLGKFSNEGDGKICIYKAGDISWTSPN